MEEETIENHLSLEDGKWVLKTKRNVRYGISLGLAGVIKSILKKK